MNRRWIWGRGRIALLGMGLGVCLGPSMMMAQPGPAVDPDYDWGQGEAGDDWGDRPDGGSPAGGFGPGGGSGPGSRPPPSGHPPGGGAGGAGGGGPRGGRFSGRPGGGRGGGGQPGYGGWQPGFGGGQPGSGGGRAGPGGRPQSGGGGGAAMRFPPGGGGGGGGGWGSSSRGSLPEPLAAEALEFAKSWFPHRVGALEELSQTRPDAYRNQLEELLQEKRRLEKLENFEPEEFALVKAEMGIESRVLDQVSKVTGEDKRPDAVQSESIKELIGKQFDAKLKIQRLKAKKLQKALDALNERINEREKNKGVVIDRRFDSLLDPAKTWSW